jgi:hypothetical protein
MLASLRPRAGEVIRRTVRTAWAVLDRARARRIELLRNAAGLPLPVYLAADGTPSAQPAQGTGPHRVLVCSVPKAGTYLVGELLRRLGVVPTGLHLSANGLTDYRFATRDEARREYSRFNHPVPLARALPLVRPGQYAVGHLECTPAVRAHLSGFKVVFIYRDLRDAFVSWLRFHRDTGREDHLNWIWAEHPDPREQLVLFLRAMGETFFETCGWLLPWYSDPAAFPVRFETLHGDDGPAARERACRELAAFLDHPDPAGAPAVLPGLLTAQTLTSSGARTRRDEYWSAAAEELFLRFGGRELNETLGYGSTGDSKRPPDPTSEEVPTSTAPSGV